MAEMMKVGLLAEPHRFIVEERPIPEVGPGEVRIRVAACGICGTDLHAYVGAQAERLEDHLSLPDGA